MAPSLGTVSISYDTTTAGNLPLWYAQDSGILRRNGIDAALQYISSTNYMASLLSGQTAVSLGGGAEVLSAVAGGADLVALGVLQPVYPYQILANASVSSPADLRGKRVGITNVGGTIDVALHVALQYMGLDPDHDVTWVTTGSTANQTAAAANGAVDAIATQPPDSLSLEALGFHSVFDMAALKLPTSGFVIVTTRSWANAHHALLQGIVDSLMEAIGQEKTDRAQALQVLSSYTKETDAAGLDATYDLYANEVFPAAPHITPDMLRDAVDQLSGNDPGIRDVDLSSVLDDSYVQDAVRRGIGAS